MEAHIFAALGDPVRLQIVELLARGERSVSDLLEHIDVHQSGVSRHLATLLECGLVQVRRDGQFRRYSLRTDSFEEIEAWASTCRQLWNTRLDRLEAILAATTRPKARNTSKEQ